MPACQPACLLLHSFYLFCVECRSLWSFMMVLQHSYTAIGMFVYVYVFGCVCVRVTEWVSEWTSKCACVHVYIVRVRFIFFELIFFHSFRCAFVLCSNKCNPLFFWFILHWLFEFLSFFFFFSLCLCACSQVQYFFYEYLILLLLQ